VAGNDCGKDARTQSVQYELEVTDFLRGVAVSYQEKYEDDDFADEDKASPASLKRGKKERRGIRGREHGPVQLGQRRSVHPHRGR
jgi:hypothetical protein